MMERLYFLLSLLLLSTLYMSSANDEEVLLSFNWNIKLKKQCTLGLYENEKTSNDYKTLKDLVEKGIAGVYTGDSDFVSASLQLFNCIGKDVMVSSIVKVKNMSDADVVIFNEKFTSKVNTSLPLLMNLIISFDLDDQPLVKSKPILYAKLAGSLAGGHFCADRNGFKKKLAKTLILANGVSTAKSSQVIFSNHPCGGDEVTLLNNVQFYVAKDGTIGQPDVALTNLAFKVVEQMIYDGTAWRLGIHLYKYLDSIELLGSAKKDTGLNDLEITYIGFGAVLGLIVLIILIVMIADCCHNNCECCKKCGGDDETDFHVAVHVETNATANEKGITNELFQTEKHHAHAGEVVNDKVYDNPSYEDVEDPNNPDYEDAEYPDIVVSPITPLTVPSEPDYVELQNAEPDDNFTPVLKEFPDVSPQQVVLGSFASYEEPIEPTYENFVESGPSTEELLAIPEFDTSSEESELDEGIDLSADDLGNMLSDDNGLVHEYEKLGNRVPGAMLYPEDVAEKNRVPGCFPWPESRVPLALYTDDPSSDYINASYVKNNRGAISYIVTQAPLLSTTDDFWRMVVEQNVNIIVMATPLNLKGQELSHQYWPRDQNACYYGDVKVQLVRKELKPDFLVMTVSVSYGKGEQQQLYLFRYMSWPQNDIPDNPKSIIAFLLEVRETSETLQSLPLIHCSSGRGMSAVLIALLNGMLEVEQTNAVNMKKVVRALRKDLPGGIECVEQYKFLHEAMYQYALFNAS